ncbi:MAG: hypothetical protein AAFR76_03360 [Planctomycetota bacterium]
MGDTPENPSLTTGAVSRVYAGVGGLSAFVIAIVVGLEAQNGAAHILLNAIVSMVACYMLGTLLGALAEHAIRAHMVRVRTENPVPEPLPAVVAETAAAPRG